ncbi:MAG: phosphatidate cytidylyltransferase [Candidatus Korobacteraceae bacterium]
MKRVLTAVILIPLVVLALFRAPLWLFALLVLGVALLAAKEYFDIAEATGFRPVRGPGYALLVCMLAFSCVYMYMVGRGSTASWQWYIGYFAGYVVIALSCLLFLSPFILLAAGLTRDPLSMALPGAASSFLLLPYIGLPLASMPIMRGSGNDALFLLFLMLLVWCGDIAAYYIGRTIGRHKLAPRISPGKTWEGAIASVVGAVVVGVLLFHHVNPIAAAFRSAHLLKPTSDFASPNSKSSVAFGLAPPWLVALFAVCVNVAAQLGDLVESALKRGAGMKDSGTLLPGHGGVLDRIDALLFALPVGLLFYLFGMSRYFEPVVIR